MCALSFVTILSSIVRVVGRFLGLYFLLHFIALHQVILIHTIGGEFPRDHLLEALAPIQGCKLELHPYLPSK